MADVEAVGKVGQSTETAEAVIARLQGPAFCQAEDLKLTEEQVADCQKRVPKAARGFSMIFETLTTNAKNVCVDLFNICTEQIRLQ